MKWLDHEQDRDELIEDLFRAKYRQLRPDLDFDDADAFLKGLLARGCDIRSDALPADVLGSWRTDLEVLRELHSIRALTCTELKTKWDEGRVHASNKLAQAIPEPNPMYQLKPTLTRHEAASLLIEKDPVRLSSLAGKLHPECDLAREYDSAMSEVSEFCRILSKGRDQVVADQFRQWRQGKPMKALSAVSLQPEETPHSIGGATRSVSFLQSVLRAVAIAKYGHKPDHVDGVYSVAAKIVRDADLRGIRVGLDAIVGHLQDAERKFKKTREKPKSVKRSAT